FVGAGWCVLHRIYTGPWELFGAQIWHPYPRAWQVNGALALEAALALAYLAVSVASRRRFDARRPLLVAASVGAFAVPFLLIKNGTAAFAAAAAWHGIQYIGIVWFYNRNRYRDGIDPRARLVSFVSQPGRAPL